MTTSTKRTTRDVGDGTKSAGGEVRAPGTRKATQVAKRVSAAREDASTQSGSRPREASPAKLVTLTSKRNAGLGTLVTRIDKVYGVKVARKPKSVQSTGPTSTEDALAIARRVGLITRNGKLASIFK